MAGEEQSTCLLDDLRALRRLGPVVWLDSQSQEHPASRVSYLAGCPDAEISCYGDRVDISDREGRRDVHTGNFFDAFRSFRQRYPGWHFGWLGYDLKNHTESLESDGEDAAGLPDLYYFRPKVLIRVDHETGRREVLCGELPHPVGGENEDYMLSNLASSMDYTSYRQVIEKAKDLIRKGDLYEINITHQLAAGFSGDPLALYLDMKRVGVVPFGAYIQAGDAALCCASPERFLSKDGDRLKSQPIKGTVKRGAGPEEDEHLKTQMLHSAKNRAENLMIVDLVRNDMSRIALPGTVKVEKLFDIQTFSTLHQMVSTICSTLPEQTDPLEAVRACFPMGSMTGTPKIRAMEWIEQLEGYRRGVYSGAIGYFTPHGDFDLNVVIRTAQIKSQRLFYNVGGAITSDSDPWEEWQESWVKARALTRVSQPGQAMHSR